MKTVLIYSGGLDSTILLSELLAEKDKVHCLNFYYGSKHNDQERARAEQIARAYGVPLQKIDMGFINQCFKSDLLRSGKKVPQGHYSDVSMKKTVVPFRNGIMLSIAIGFAESIGYDRVAIANHAGDHAIYPDCRNTFIQSMDEAARYGTYKNIEVYSPFLYMTKGAIVEKGMLNNAPVFITWSCYNPVARTSTRPGSGWMHCGKCGTCVERIEAFRQAHVRDETPYADEKYAIRLLKKKHGPNL